MTRKGERVQVMTQAPSGRLGELLIRKGAITPETLAEALHEQAVRRVPLGQILIEQGACKPIWMYQALAEQQGKPFINMLLHSPDPACSHADDHADYVRLQCVPWRVVNGYQVLAVTSETAELLTWARQKFGYRYVTVWTCPRDVREVLQQRFQLEDTQHATDRLKQQQPEATAATLRWHSMGWRYLLTMGVFSVLACGMGAWGMHAAYVLVCVVIVATIGFKGWASVAGIRLMHQQKPIPLPLHAAQLPTYSVLIALYDEASVVPQLLQALRGLDYPRDRLQVLLVLEQEDDATYRAIAGMQPEAWIEIIRIADSSPRTKPKALNIALRYARGELITIFDAEDKPEAGQLREAAMHFHHHAEQPFLCVQARLNYENHSQNLLTRLFALEYACWFELMLPGMATRHLPIPLGGTSNHFRRRDLEQLLAWDAYNVTEDADLGLRLYTAGGRTRMLQSRTWEEAPIHIRAWLKQRSRWVKGYMTTYLVHRRMAGQWVKQHGMGQWMTVCLFVAGPCLLFLLTPWLLAYWLAGACGWLQGNWVVHDSLLWCGYGALLASVLLHLLQAWQATRTMRRLPKRYRLSAWPCLLFPLYWLLHSIAAYMAVVDMMRRPYFWAKTSHGFAKYT